MTATAAGVAGVLAVDRIRVRWTGHRLEADADIAVQGGLSVVDGHEIADRVEHELLHATPHLESVVVHLHPVVDGRRPHDLHELSGHHASAEAREAYRTKLAEHR
jgi:divalent metal cation (Fe/Co/Zn/Cd) transporter